LFRVAAFEITSDDRFAFETAAEPEESWEGAEVHFPAGSQPFGCLDATMRSVAINRQCTPAQFEVKMESTA
jgi:hypothetical protein